MNKKEYNTLKNFVKSNDSFYDVIKNKSPISTNIYIEIELIILYFKINNTYLNKLSSDDYELICNLLENNYTIEDDFIVINDSQINIKYFINLVNQIELQKNQTRTSKVIKIDFSAKKESKNRNKKTKILDLTDFQRNIYFTMKEREFIFENKTEINDTTLPFILKANSYFKELINYLILNILRKRSLSCDSKYIDLLFFYLSLYPFVNYSQNRISIPFEDLELPQSEIGLRKTTYEDDYLKSLELETQQLESKKNTLSIQKANLEQYSSNYKAKVSRIDAHISAIEDKQLDIYYTHYAYRNTNEIYNCNLLQYLIKSFEQGNVFISDSFQDPIIKFFYINDEIVEFYCAMHLTTLLKLYDGSKLLPTQIEEKKLEVVI